MHSWVVYFRVSTARQGRSGLGLEAQRAAVASFLAVRNGRVVGEFTEVESGRKRDRPQLAAALDAARLWGATLLVAKLDRLARDAVFLLSLRDAGIDLTAADMPDANRLMVGILALVAEQEREAISTRTKAALAARKARGLPLGHSPTLWPGDADGAARARAARSAQAERQAQRVFPIIQELREQGLSLRRTAAELNARHVPSPKGGRWTATSVGRAWKRLTPLIPERQ